MKTGLLHAVMAPISSETRGSAMNYGTAQRLDPMMKADIAFTRNNQKVYGDNGIVESDNGISGGKITFDPTDLLAAHKAAMLGHVASGNGYFITDAPSPYVGFGYVAVNERTSGSVKTITYIAYWLYKVQFSMNADSSETQKESKTYKNPTLEGELFGVYTDGTGTPRFVYTEVCGSEAEAIALVDGLAGLSLSQVATPAADPVAGAVAAGSTVALTSATSGAVIYYTTDGSTPTTGSQVYASPLYIDRATTIKAIAVKSGMNNSAVFTAAYTISE